MFLMKIKKWEHFNHYCTMHIFYILGLFSFSLLDFILGEKRATQVWTIFFLSIYNLQFNKFFFEQLLKFKNEGVFCYTLYS